MGDPKRPSRSLGVSPRSPKSLEPSRVNRADHSRRGAGGVAGVSAADGCVPRLFKEHRRMMQAREVEQYFERTATKGLDNGGHGDNSETTNSPYPYSVEGGHIVRYRETKDGVIVDSLCNFDSQIKEDIILDDGADQTRAFVIDGRLDTGVLLPAVRIPASRFNSMIWVTESWGM